MKEKLCLAMIVFLWTILPGRAPAGGCGCVPISLPSGEQFKFHNESNLRVGCATTYSNTDHYYIGTERQDGAGEVEETVAPSTLGFDNVFSLEYDLPRSFAVALEIPIVHTEQSREFGGVSGSMNATGLGDISLLARRWFRTDPTGFSLHGALGVRLPTGKSDKQFRAQSGAMVTQDLAAQAGTGNFAGIVEFGGSTYFADRYGFAFVTRYTFTPSATTVNNFRNELTGNGSERNSDSDALTTRLSLATPLGTGDSFLGRFSGEANLDLAWIPFDDLFGDTDGFRRAGVIVALGPGLSFNPAGGVTVSAGLPLTLYRDVQHNGGNVQDWTFQMGITLDRLR